MQTIAAVLTGLDKPLELRSLAIPELKPGQVLVDVAYSGVCHTQLHEIRGRRGPDRFIPHTLGHEGSGIVRAVAPGVAKVKPGDHVVVSWIAGRGAAVPGTLYRDGAVTVNSGAVSTLMRSTVTCENRITPIPAGMPLREAALLGCALPTGAGIVVNTASLKPGQTVAVFGVGGVGMSALLGAVMQKASVIIAVDVFDHKLAQAKALGATHTVNARQRDPLAAVLEITDKRGVDCAVEAAGTKETMETAFRSVRDKGGLCVLAGNLPHGGRMELDPFDLIKGKRIVGTWGGETRPDEDIPRYIEEYQAGRLKLSLLITHEYPLERINEAFTDLEKGRVGRALIDMAAGK